MSSNGSAPQRFRIAIVGAGFAGLGMAIRLKQAGIDDFVILERADDVGGTWRDNSYPGCAVDVQSHLYSFSFAPNPDWSQVYSPQAEIWDYIRRVSQQHDVLRHVRFRHEVTGGDWDESTQRWTVRTTAGAFDAQYVISGMGSLSNPVPPEIPGLDTFAGHCFHSARHEAADLIRDLRGLGREHRPAIDAALEQFEHWPVPTPSDTVPTTIAWGRCDLLLFPHQARRARKAFPAARFVPLPGLGHVPMTDDPERVAAVLLDARV